MTTVHEVPTHERPRATAPALTLTDEHSRPLRQVAIRAEDALAVIAESRWPTAELRALIGYLRAEVLRQAGDEEWLLFPANDVPPGFARLSDHVRLRVNIDVLARSDADRGACSPAQLAITTRDLLAQLARHLAAEETLLAAAALRTRCRRRPSHHNSARRQTPPQKGVLAPLPARNTLTGPPGFRTGGQSFSRPGGRGLGQQIHPLLPMASAGRRESTSQRTRCRSRTRPATSR